MEPRGKTAAPRPGAALPAPETSLTEANAETFWNAAWTAHNVGWRKAEEKPYFTRNLFVFTKSLAIKSGEPTNTLFPQKVTAAMDAANALNGPSEEAVVREFLSGKNVFVPLCGDSPALRYFAEHGAAAVTGADLASESLRLQRECRFAGVDFACRHIERPGGKIIKLYEGNCGGCSVRLWEGDLFDLPQLETYRESSFDFVYDRAAMMAIHPRMRTAYVRSIVAALSCTAGLMVERPIRDDDDQQGPPFTFSPNEVLSLYESETGRRYDMLSILENRFLGSPEAGKVHYLEFIRLLPETG